MACAGTPVRFVISDLELLIPYNPQPTSATRLATGEWLAYYANPYVPAACNLELHGCGCGMWKTLKVSVHAE